MILLLVLETGVNGVFASLDYLLFFLFWQMQAVPMFLLIARFGGQRRLQAAWKFLAVDIAGSALLLLAILILYFKAPVRTFDIVTLHDVALPTAIATLIAWLFFIAFAVKLPVFPFHTWFIDAQAEASAPVALILGGVLVKLGGYGIIRVEVSGGSSDGSAAELRAVTKQCPVLRNVDCSVSWRHRAAARSRVGCAWAWLFGPPR